jgi:hypothetical protein
MPVLNATRLAEEAMIVAVAGERDESLLNAGWSRTDIRLAGRWEIGGLRDCSRRHESGALIAVVRACRQRGDLVV